jgi:hypothetical protein
MFASWTLSVAWCFKINKVVKNKMSNQIKHYCLGKGSIPHTKFLSLIIDDSLLCKAHIDQMMSNLNTACFVIRLLQAIMSTETLRIVYFAYVHSVMSYGIIFWGNQPYSEIFKIQKRAIRIITNSRMRDSCRELFQRLEILPLYSQYYPYTHNITPILTIYFLSINIRDKKQTSI